MIQCQTVAALESLAVDEMRGQRRKQELQETDPFYQVSIDPLSCTRQGAEHQVSLDELDRYTLWETKEDTGEDVMTRKENGEGGGTTRKLSSGGKTWPRVHPEAGIQTREQLGAASNLC